MPTERDIRELLIEHDLVIVPGFGGLLGHRRAARLDETHRLIHPPAKDISFNRNLVRNDGLLADRIASRRRLPHDEALAAISTSVERWQRAIADHGRLELEGIGTFHRDPDGNLQFDADRRVNLLKDATGLRAIPAVPVRAAAPAPAPIVRKLEPVPAPAQRAVAVEPQQEGRSVALWAAAIATGVLFAAGAWVLAGDNIRERMQLSGFDPFGPSTEPRWVAQAAPIAFDPVDDGSWSPPPGQYGVQALPIAGAAGPLVKVDLGSAPVPTVAIGTAVTSPVGSPADKTHVATTPRMRRYHLVGGCFSVKENADRFLADLVAKGYDATLIDQHRGLYRVAFGSYANKAAAMEALEALRGSSGGEAWLLVK